MRPEAVPDTVAAAVDDLVSGMAKAAPRIEGHRPGARSPGATHRAAQTPTAGSRSSCPAPAFGAVIRLHFFPVQAAVEPGASMR